MRTKELIKEVLKELKNGEVTLEAKDGIPWKFFAKLNVSDGETTSFEDALLPTLLVKNIDDISARIDSYLDVAKTFYALDKSVYNLYEDTFEKKLVFDLILNATNYDFLNFDKYVDLRTEMLKTKVEETEINIGNITFPFESVNLSVKIKKNDSKLEGPYKLTPIFKSANGTFVAPSITFGIVNKTVFVYAIQSQRDKQENTLAKKLDRYFRKFNKDVDLNEIEGMVSSNALASATIFFACMNRQGIKDVVAPAFLPGRYFGTKSAIENKKIDATEKEDKLEKHDKNQFNMTNRFTYTLARYAMHFDGCEFVYDDNTQLSHLTLSKEHGEGDNEIFDFKNQIDNNLRQCEISK